jgi:hypothetical protein
VKIEQALVLYLLKHKQISLQGIGTFKIDGLIPDSTDNDKPVIIPADAVSFTYDPKTKEEPDLVDFIVVNTKKIKPLASADLDSFLTLGRQFLNIGKPFTIQNLGTLEKLSNGELEFKPGPLIQRVEAPKAKIEDEGAEKHEENLFNDYQKNPQSNSGKRALLLTLVILILASGAWAVWHFVYNKNNSEQESPTEGIVPVVDSAALIKKSDSLAAAQKLMDSIKLSQTNPADTFNFKIVLKTTTDKNIATSRFEKLKSLGRNVIMYTHDSITYKVAEPFMLPLSDTTKVLDSLNRYFYGGRAHLEIK